MRILVPVLIIAALAVAACEPKTPAEKLGDVVEDVVEPTPKTPGEKLGSAVEEAGDDIQDRSR